MVFDRAGEHKWASNNFGLQPISSEPPLPNTICRDLYSRMAKMKIILSTFTLLSCHLTGLKRFPVETFSHVIKR